MAKVYLTIGVHNPYSDTDNVNRCDAYTLFPNSFMQTYTKHKNIMDFCEAIGCNLSQEESHKLFNGFYDDLIRQHSNFESWEAMCETAMEYTKS